VTVDELRTVGLLIAFESLGVAKKRNEDRYVGDPSSYAADGVTDLCRRGVFDVAKADQPNILRFPVEDS
jgi:hypothetical protein